MKDILSLHPDVGSHSFEYRFIIDPDGIMDFYNSVISSWSPYLIDNKLQRLEKFLKLLSRKGNKKRYSDYELSKYFINYDEAIDKLINSLVDFKYDAYYYGLEKKRELYFMNKNNESLELILGTFINDLIFTYLKDNNKSVYVEDNTHNVLFVDKLVKILPQSKFIHMMRDPLDVISSLSKQRWAPNDPIKTTYYYKSIMDRWNLLASRVSVDSYRCVDLYELVDDTENTLIDICQFIGLSYDDNMLNIDLGGDNRGRWKKELTNKDLNKILNILDS